jgi:hypothetical protein
MSRAFILVAAMIALSGAAWAEGSITLTDVMDQLKDNEKLIGEIASELKAQGVAADAVICVGARFGGHWAELGGARSVPYECEIGKKTLNIGGTVKLYDEAGKEIDMSDERAPERAFDYKETDLSWKWK